MLVCYSHRLHQDQAASLYTQPMWMRHSWQLASKTGGILIYPVNVSVLLPRLTSRSSCKSIFATDVGVLLPLACIKTRQSDEKSPQTMKYTREGVRVPSRGDREHLGSGHDKARNAVCGCQNCATWTRLPLAWRNVSSEHAAARYHGSSNRHRPGEHLRVDGGVLEIIHLQPNALRIWYSFYIYIYICTYIYVLLLCYIIKRERCWAKRVL